MLFTYEEASSMIGKWFRTSRRYHVGASGGEIPEGALAKVVAIEDMNPPVLIPSDAQRRFLVKVRWHEDHGKDRFDAFNKGEWDCAMTLFA